MAVVNDKRSMVVVPVCHCVLNQNAKLEGIANWPGSIKEVIQILLNHGVGILQMPCPECIYEGIGRFDKSIEQYNCSYFRDLCKKITKEIVDQIENYLDWEYKVPVILAIDGSPSCGYNITQTAPEWRGLVSGMNWQKVRYKPGPGIFMDSLATELHNHGFEIPIIGIPEIPELGSLSDVVDKLNAILTFSEERR